MADEIKLSASSEAVLKFIAQGYSYERIVKESQLTYVDIFRAAQEALDIIQCAATAGISLPPTGSHIKYDRTYEDWDQEEEAKLTQLIKSGSSSKDVALELRRRPVAVRKRMAKLGLVEPRMHPLGTGDLANRGQPWTAQDEKQLMELYDSGKSFAEMAKFFKRTEGGIDSRINLLRNERAVGQRRSGGKRELGKHPVDGEPVSLFSGRFGPFIQHNEDLRNIPRSVDVAKITLEQALMLLSQPPTNDSDFHLGRTLPDTVRKYP